MLSSSFGRIQTKEQNAFVARVCKDGGGGLRRIEDVVQVIQVQYQCSG